MSLRPIADVISKQLSGIFSGIDPENVQSSIWDGTLELTDLTLNKARLNPKLGSVRILSSHVDKVRVSIPWKRIYEDSAILEVEGLNLQLLCDRTVPLETLWFERLRLIETIQESLKLEESLGIFASLLRTMFRKARILFRNVMINISIGDADMLTFRFDTLSVEPDSSMQDISSEALNKIAIVENLSLALNGREILESNEASNDGIRITCHARIIQGSVSLSLELPRGMKVSIRDANMFDIVTLLFEQQKTLASFKPPPSSSALESLRIEYLYMLENPSPNWTDRKRFIELSVNPVTVATWRRQASRATGINVRELFTSISSIGSPDRTPPTTTEDSQLLSGPLKIDMRFVDAVIAIDLPNTPVFSLDISKLVMSLVFPVGRNALEFTGRFIFSRVTARVHDDKLIEFDVSVTVLRSFADGFEYDFSLKHSKDGLHLSPRALRNLNLIIEALPTQKTSDVSIDEVMENVEFLAKDVKDSKIQIAVDPLDIHVTLSEEVETVVFRIGEWNCTYSYTAGLQTKSQPVTILEKGNPVATIPSIQIMTDENGVTSFFIAGSLEIGKFPRSLFPKQLEIRPDILDSPSLRVSHGLFYRIMKLLNLRNLVFHAPSIMIENNSLAHVQVDVILSDEGFDVLGSTSSCTIEEDEVLRTFMIDPIPSKPNKVVTVRVSHMGTVGQTPIYIETGALSLSIDLQSGSKPTLEVPSIINLVEALKPMLDINIPKVSLAIVSDFDICTLRIEKFRFTKGCLEISKLDCEFPDMESIIRRVHEDTQPTIFDPSNILPPIHVRELYAMGRFEGLNEDVVVGCTNLVHSSDTNYSVSHIFLSTEAGCVLEFRNLKANRHRAESVDGVVINLSRQLIKFIEGIIDSAPGPTPSHSVASIPYKVNLTPVHFNFRDEHIISHVELALDVSASFESDGPKQVIDIAESSRISVRRIELKELHTNTLVLRNDTRVVDTLHVEFSGKVVVPTDRSATIQVNFPSIDLRNGFKVILEDMNEIKRLFELIPDSQKDSPPKRAIDLSCAIAILDPINIIAYSSGRPITSSEVQAGLISVYHSATPNVRSISKVLIPEIKIHAAVRNLKRGSWESLLQDSAFSLEMSDIRGSDNPDSGSLKINLSGLGEVAVGLTPRTFSCIRTMTESTRDTKLEATGSDTFHVVNLINRVIEFRKDSHSLHVIPKNSAVVADSVIMKDDDGIELINFRVLETNSRPSVSSLSLDDRNHDASDWTIVDVTGSADIVLEDFDIRIQIVYNIELNKKLIVVSFQRSLRNESEMPLILQIRSDGDSGGQFGVPFALQCLSDGYAWFKTSRRGSLEDTQYLGGSKHEIVLMHKEAVSVGSCTQFSIKPFGSSDFGYSSPLPVSLPANRQYGLCCQPTSDTHAFPLYVRIDQSDADTSGAIHLRPCGLIVNNLPCPVEVEVVSSEGILYIESEQITRNSLRVLYNIDLSYCRIRLRCPGDDMCSDWSENIYFDGNIDGASLRLSVRNALSGSVVNFSLTYSTTSDTKSISLFHPFWLSNCTDVNVIPTIMTDTKQVESIQLGQEGLWYIQPEFDRKLNSSAVTLMRPHSAGSIVSVESMPLEGNFTMMTDSFCLLDPMVIHADTVRNRDEPIELESGSMEYTLFSILPRFIVENTMLDKVIILRQFGGGTEYMLSSKDKISLSFSSLERSPDVQFRIVGQSRWSRFAVSLDVDGYHPLFVLSEGTTETSEPINPIPVSIKVDTVRGITYIRLCDGDNPLYVVENRCPYIHSVIALAPKLRLGTTDDKSVDEIVFSPSPDDETRIPIYFENTDRKVVRLMICFDQSSRFKEVELDVSQLTNVLGDAVKARESIMNARQPILVACQGFPVVMVSVVRSSSKQSQIVVAVTPKDMSMSNWLGGFQETKESGIGDQVQSTGKVSISVSCPRLTLNVCDSFVFYVDEMTIKIGKKKIDEFSINELFAKSVLAEQTRSEEQVVFATVDREKGLLATADRISHQSVASDTPLSFSDVHVVLSPMELTISNSILDDIEYVISSFREAIVDQKQLVLNSAAIIARSGTPYCLTVDIQSVLETTKMVRLVEFHDLHVSEILIHAWSELVYNRSKFISPEIRLILSILSLSDTLKLDGAEIRLPSEHIFRKLWRGPSSQLLSTIGDIYKKSLAENAASFSVVASSNVLNVVGGGLFRSSRDKKVIKKRND